MTQSVPPRAERENRLSSGAGKAAKSTVKGDIPAAVLDRYLIERDLRGRPERFFRDHRATEPMFQDRGRSLVSHSAYPDAVIDMLKIARHRGWSAVRVSGDPGFRREVWIQAQALGLEVKGHRPGERNRQAAGLEPRPPLSAEIADRMARAAVVVRRLIPDAALQTRLMAEALDRFQARRTARERAPDPTRDRHEAHDRSRSR
jgi:hypothetical protein